MLKTLAITLTALCISSCGAYSSYVDSEDSALGRVVIYRNGVAYFERRAIIEDDRLTLRVPRDKVDDFLKSLTVSDRKTGKSLPVSFPTRGAAKDGNVEMSIHLPGKGPHDLNLSYITESPAWKPSYRITVDSAGKIGVQAWAIIDNTSGEDWRDIKLGVGSSSALSFRYDLRSIRSVYREQLNGGQQFAHAPPIGAATHGGTKATSLVFAQLKDGEIPRPPGHPDYPRSGSSGSSVKTPNTAAKSGRSTYKPRQRRPHRSRRLKKLAKKLKESSRQFTIEGYAEKTEPNADERSLDRANLLRNQLIMEGVSPDQLKVKSGGHKLGMKAGVRLVQNMNNDDSSSDNKRSQFNSNNGEPIGISHFESNVTTTVPRGTSSMVSMLNEDTEGHLVYLYYPNAKRGNKRYAFRAVRFKNPSNSTLDSGPVTVYGNGRFIGEGLSEAIPPRATAVIPFAMDRQIVVNAQEERKDRISHLITLNRGVLRAELEHTKRTVLKLTNRLNQKATVLIRHTLSKGWTLNKGPKLFETQGTSQLFEVTIKAGQTKIVTIEESTPMQRMLDLRSTIGVDLVRLYLKTPHDDQRFETPMKALLKINGEMANHSTTIQSLRDRQLEYRARLNELHMQIVSLKAFKAGGTLTRHLRAKMRQISAKVQQLTLDVVNHQEKLMLAKIRFQDGLSELTLTPKVSKQKSENVDS